MNTFFIWESTGELEIEESANGLRYLYSGIFLKLNSPSRNKGRQYRIEEAEQIARELLNKPVYWGVDEKNRHITDEKNKIGRVLKAFVDRATNTIRGLIEVTGNRYLFGIMDFLSKVKKIGFSIKGKAEKLLNGRVYGMKPNSLQIMPLETPRGFNEATGELVEESYSFDIEESAGDDEDRIRRMAQARFDLEKSRIIDTARAAGVSTSRIEEMLEKIETPTDLEAFKNAFDLISLAKFEGLQRQPDPNPSNLRGGGVVRQIPGETETPRHRTYESIREGISDLYTRASLGDLNAERDINKLWEKGIELLKKMPQNFAIIECQGCASVGRSTGILEGEVCPICGWSSADYLRKADLR